MDDKDQIIANWRPRAAMMSGLKVKNRSHQAFERVKESFA
jgi:hypothetical protein